MSKLAQAIHYVVNITKPEELGRTKLAKVLFYADLEAYRRTGKPITNAVYEKRQHGPLTRELYAAIDKLCATGQIARRDGNFHGSAQHQFWALKEPTLDGLSAQDVATLTEATRTICDNYTATAISDLSHNVAWEVAELGEEIPFAAYLAASGRGEPTADELRQIDAVLG